MPRVVMGKRAAIRAIESAIGEIRRARKVIIDCNTMPIGDRSTLASYARIDVWRMDRTISRLEEVKAAIRTGGIR